MIPREIVGPQGQFERNGAQGLRDVRPLVTRLSEALRSSASGIVLGILAGLTYIEPAVLDATVVGGSLYAFWVLTRRVTLPIRKPYSAGGFDYGNPDPATRKPRPSAGSINIGIDQLTGQELWLTNEDARQHCSIPGTTGAGKTTAIVSLLANAMTHSSGFVLVDGKASNELYAQVLALARRFGREDDVLCLNLLTASLPASALTDADRQSNTFNPFAVGNADAIRELLASQLGEQRADDPNGLFRGRAIALIGTMTPVLVWMRDHAGVPITIETIRQSLEMRVIWTLQKHRVYLIRDQDTGKAIEIPVPTMPEELIYPLHAYLNELPGYDTTLPYTEQRTEKPSEQHGFAMMYFTGTFTQLAVSLGHIFKVRHAGDIDMRDVVLNRRILVVNLPALENSDDTLAALGKLVVASVRGMMAQLLGARIEGDPKEIFPAKPGMGVGPFQVVFDEMAYYATGGMDRMLAMGRSLNLMFMLAFQELGGVWARLGEKTGSLLGNANLTIAMRQQDSSRTKEWLERTAGQTWVTQASSFVGTESGSYRESGHADLRQVSRVDWQDLQKLIEGEAIVLFGGRRIYAKIFHAALDTTGPIRLNRPLTLSPPKPGTIDGDARRIAYLVEVLTEGVVAPPQTEHSPVIDALLTGFADEARAGGTAHTCGEAAVARVASVLPSLPHKPSALIRNQAGMPNTEFSPMLDGGEDLPQTAPAGSGMPADPVSARLLAGLCRIEARTGASPAEARKAAIAAIAERDAALARAVPSSRPQMPPQELQALVENLTTRVKGLAPTASGVQTLRAKPPARAA